MGSNNILILIPLLKGNEIKNIKEETFALLENLKEKLQKEGINYNIAVGNYYPELEGIKTSYREILETFAIIEKLKIRNKIYFTFDKNLEILISSIRKELIGNYKYHFLNNEETVKLFQDKKTLDTLDAFFDSNFNTTISSRKLNITRNTLNNRLDKVKRVTGYDPKVFNDAIKLKILLIIDEIRD
jgi:carbohydrate diacid regulator